MFPPSQDRAALLDSLVDIRRVKIDPSLPMETRVQSYLAQVKNPYLFKVGDTVVRVSYADTQLTMNETFANMIASL